MGDGSRGLGLCQLNSGRWVNLASAATSIGMQVTLEPKKVLNRDLCKKCSEAAQSGGFFIYGNRTFQAN